MARGKHSKRREAQDSSVASSVEARGLKLRPVEARLPPSFLLHHLHHISAIRQINALRCPHFILPGGRQLPLSLYGNADRHPQLRADTVTYMSEQRQNFEPFLEDNEDFDSYVSRMSEDGCWAGNLELQAASLLHGVNICVHLPGSGSGAFKLQNFPQDLYLHLAYDGSYGHAEHYDSVIQAGTESSQAGGPFPLPEASAEIVAANKRTNATSASDEALKLEHVQKIASYASKEMVLEALRASNHDVEAAVDLATEWTNAGISQVHEAGNAEATVLHDADADDDNDANWDTRKRSSTTASSKGNTTASRKRQSNSTRLSAGGKAARKQEKKERKRRERTASAAEDDKTSGVAATKPSTTERRTVQYGVEGALEI